MRTYIVTRYGSNAANQPLCQAIDLGFVQARTRSEALEKAQRQFDGVCFNNQHIGVTPESRVTSTRYNSLVEDLSMGI